MTILPKKKTQNNQKTDGETADQNPAENGRYSGRNSPPRGPWGPGAPQGREEKRPLEESGPSKRRHRASPHRSVRKHRPGPGGGGNKPPGIAAQDGPGPSGSQTQGNINIVQADPQALSLDQQENQGDFSGYNSGDEYGAGPSIESNTQWSEEEWAERERLFEKKLRKKGLVIKKMGEDGACLFRAVSDQVYGDQEMNGTVRKHCMDYMAKNADYFSQYVTEDFDTYITRKRLNHIHGNHIEMQAMSEMYNRTIEVYHYSSEPINIFQGMNCSGNEPIRLSYHKNIHYNSIVDPYKATVGVGLGLPGFVPGLADKNMMRDAIRQSEDFHIEQTMLEDKMKATDWEATNEAIEEQVARESYLEWLRDNEKRARKQTPRTATATCSSSASANSPGSKSPRSRGIGSPGNSPLRDSGNSLQLDEDLGACSSNTNSTTNKIKDENVMLGIPRCGPGPSWKTPSESDYSLLETASFMNQLPPGVFGLSEWEDADILAQVLAASQQEYLDNLKRTASSSSPPPSTSSFSPYCSSSSSSSSSSSALTFLPSVSQAPSALPLAATDGNDIDMAEGKDERSTSVTVASS